MRGIFKKRGNVWIWGAVGMVVGPAVLRQTKRITGIGLSLPTIGNGG